MITISCVRVQMQSLLENFKAKDHELQGRKGQTLSRSHDVINRLGPDTRNQHSIPRTQQQRVHDHPQHIGDTRPFNGMQIRQKSNEEHDVVLKKVKVERDNAM